MQNNGFYAAMKTNEGVQAVYIDEGTFQAQQAQVAEDRRRRAWKAKRKKVLAAQNSERRAAICVLKQELKLVGMGLVLYWGFCAGLVELTFMVPVLTCFQTVVCFRAGRWFGNRERR